MKIGEPIEATEVIYASNYFVADADGNTVVAGYNLRQAVRLAQKYLHDSWPNEESVEVCTSTVVGDTEVVTRVLKIEFLNRQESRRMFLVSVTGADWIETCVTHGGE